jgi:hypothetical protein
VWIQTVIASHVAQRLEVAHAARNHARHAGDRLEDQEPVLAAGRRRVFLRVARHEVEGVVGAADGRPEHPVEHALGLVLWLLAQLLLQLLLGPA